MSYDHSVIQVQRCLSCRKPGRNPRLCLTWLVLGLICIPALVLAEPTHAKLPFSLAFSAGTGYGYFDGSQDKHDFIADFRVAVSSRGYIKFGYRTQQTDVDSDPNQYLLLAGFMTTPKTSGGPTRGYMEFGAGYGNQGGASEQFLVAAQGGALIPFGQGSNFGLDLGLFFLGSFFDSDAGTSVSIGAQAGLIVMFGPKS